MGSEQLSAQAMLDQASAHLRDALQATRETAAIVKENTRLLRACLTALDAIAPHRGQCPILDEAYRQLWATLEQVSKGAKK